MNPRRIYEPIADDLKAAEALLGSTFGESQNLLYPGYGQRRPAAQVAGAGKVRDSITRRRGLMDELAVRARQAGVTKGRLVGAA